VTTCAQPGYGGVIQDGYCDTCGLAASVPSGPSAPSASTSGATSGAASGQSSRSRSRSRGRGSSRSARGRLGAGLVEIPPVPYRDPASAVEILRAALDWCATGQPAGNGPILGCEPNARALRSGLERSYRALARLTPDEDRRIELVDLANAIRPRTLT
jgi:hypothetical protein